MIRIVIIEDSTPFSELVRTYLKKVDDILCLASFRSTEEALANYSGLNADVALVDLALPGRSGIDCIRELRLRHPELRAMVLTQHEDTERVFQALRAGASGYCLKRTPPDQIVQAVRSVHIGEGWMSPSVARLVADFFKEPAPSETLSQAEKEVLEWMKRGASEKGIAQKLDLSVETVRTHRKRIMAKLHARSREEVLMGFGLKTRKGQPL